MIPDPILAFFFLVAVAAALWGGKLLKDEMRLKW